jgi:hypothetical protein
MLKSLITIVLISLSAEAYAQISLTGAGSCSQDFNSLADTGSSAVLPAGWFFHESG